MLDNWTPPPEQDGPDVLGVLVGRKMGENGELCTWGYTNYRSYFEPKIEVVVDLLCRVDYYGFSRKEGNESV